MTVGTYKGQLYESITAELAHSFEKLELINKMKSIQLP